jgi:predicted helicase
VEQSTSTNINSLYDSYIRALRWASDRVKDKGIICFVSNGSFIDGNAMSGLRKCLTEEFAAIYCFNLRGNQRTSGETSRQEGGKIFGSGSRAQIAITLLVKNRDHTGECQLFYHDIGDYLRREEKLKIIADFSSIKSIPWKPITPNKSHDWINQRDEAFEKFMPLGLKEDKGSQTVEAMFVMYSRGVATSRDSWAYNFSEIKLADNMKRMIDFFNEQSKAFVKTSVKGVKVSDFIDCDPKKISWSRGLVADVESNKHAQYEKGSIRPSYYRPFTKEYIYFHRQFNDWTVVRSCRFF